MRKYYFSDLGDCLSFFQATEQIHVMPDKHFKEKRKVNFETIGELMISPQDDLPRKYMDKAILGDTYRNCVQLKYEQKPITYRKINALMAHGLGYEWEGKYFMGLNRFLNFLRTMGLYYAPQFALPSNAHHTVYSLGFRFEPIELIRNQNKILIGFELHPKENP